MDEIFRALADPTRRSVLDALFAQDGQTLGSLEARFEKGAATVFRKLNPDRRYLTPRGQDLVSDPVSRGVRGIRCVDSLRVLYRDDLAQPFSGIAASKVDD